MDLILIVLVFFLALRRGWLLGLSAVAITMDLNLLASVEPSHL